MNFKMFLKAVSCLLLFGRVVSFAPPATRSTLAPVIVSQPASTRLFYGEVRGIDTQLLFDTWEWTANLGAPAALVAGAVLATMVDSREVMDLSPSDGRVQRIAKKLLRFLLVSSFALEVISIFATTVTGTMLLSLGDAPGKIVASSSPIGFLRGQYEFEYLASRITFLQGLFHWLASVALETVLASPKEGESRRMNQFFASSLMTIIVAMLSFLNKHITFYDNYWTMLCRFVVLSFRTFIWPLRPLTIIMLPMTAYSLFLGYKALVHPSMTTPNGEKASQGETKDAD